jgi:hypothetical protein
MASISAARRKHAMSFNCAAQQHLAIAGHITFNFERFFRHRFCATFPHQSYHA